MHDQVPPRERCKLGELALQLTVLVEGSKQGVVNRRDIRLIVFLYCMGETVGNKKGSNTNHVKSVDEHKIHGTLVATAIGAVSHFSRFAVSAKVQVSRQLQVKIASPMVVNIHAKFTRHRVKVFREAFVEIALYQAHTHRATTWASAAVLPALRALKERGV